MGCLHLYTKQNNKIFIQRFRCAVALWKSCVCKYSIRFQVIKIKLLCETLKNEKFFLDIQTKCGDIANEILNAAIDAAGTFKCKWPKPQLLILFKMQSPIITTLFDKSSMPFSSCRESLFLSLLMRFLYRILWLHLLFDISWELATNCVVKKWMIILFLDSYFSNSKILFLRISTYEKISDVTALPLTLFSDRFESCIRIIWSSILCSLFYTLSPRSLNFFSMTVDTLSTSCSFDMVFVAVSLVVVVTYISFIKNDSIFSSDILWYFFLSVRK